MIVSLVDGLCIDRCAAGRRGVGRRRWGRRVVICCIWELGCTSVRFGVAADRSIRTPASGFTLSTSQRRGQSEEHRQIRVVVQHAVDQLAAASEEQTGRLLYHEADGDFTGGSLAMTAGALVFTQADTLMKEYGADLRRSDESSESEIFEHATLIALDGGTGREVFSLRGGSRGTLSDDGLITLIGRKQLIAVDLNDVREAVPAKATVNVRRSLSRRPDTEDTVSSPGSTIWKH